MPHSAPSDQPINKPGSGTYGERKELDDLKRSLPTTGAGPATPPSGPGPAPLSPDPIRPVSPKVGRPSVPAGPPGVPPVILQPTDFPSRPVNTPLDPGAPAPLAPPSPASLRGRILILNALANSPEVSEDTREWSALMLDLIGG